MSENVDLNFPATLCQQTLAEVRSLRKEVSDVRTLALQNVDYTRRIERRMTEVRDDLELIFKAEIGGSFANSKRGWKIRSRRWSTGSKLWKAAEGSHPSGKLSMS